MAKLRETIDRLVAALATDIIAALRDVPLTEMTTLVSNGAGVPARKPAAKVARRKSSAKNRSARTSKSAAAVREPDPAAIAAAEGFFVQRGQRGATAAQLREALGPQGEGAATDADVVISLLVDRGVLRDAGFRRTTGTGTRPCICSRP